MACQAIPMIEATRIHLTTVENSVESNFVPLRHATAEHRQKLQQHEKKIVSLQRQVQEILEMALGLGSRVNTSELKISQLSKEFAGVQAVAMALSERVTDLETRAIIAESQSTASSAENKLLKERLQKFEESQGAMQGMFVEMQAQLDKLVAPPLPSRSISRASEAMSDLHLHNRTFDNSPPPPIPPQSPSAKSTTSGGE